MPKPRGVGSPHYGGESGEIILALLNHSHHPASSICTGMEVRYFTNHSKVNFSFYLPSNFQKLKLQERLLLCQGSGTGIRMPGIPKTILI